MPPMWVYLPEKATIWLKKEQVQGEYIIYFISLVPLNWKNWAFSQMEQVDGIGRSKELPKVMTQLGGKEPEV